MARQPDEIREPQRLGLRSWVNGAPRQDSNTEDMIFSVAALIWELSQVTVLEPGDVINTGTPQGVALSGKFDYLRQHDTVELAIEGLGTQKQHIRAAVREGTGLDPSSVLRFGCSTEWQHA